MVLITDSRSHMASLQPLNIPLAFVDTPSKFSLRAYSLSQKFSNVLLTIDQVILSPYLTLMYKKRDENVIVDLTKTRSIGLGFKNDMLKTVKAYARIMGVEMFLADDYEEADELYKGTGLKTPSIQTTPSISIPSIYINPYLTAAIPLSILVLIGAIVILTTRSKKTRDEHILAPNLLHFEVGKNLERDAFRLVGKNQENVRGGQLFITNNNKVCV